jgi:hypothetical protein
VSWTAPITWTASVVTVAQMNQQIRDNMTVLKTSINDDGTLKAPQRLGGGSGTSTAAGSTNLNTLALASGLTAEDQLLFHVTCSEATQAVARLDIASTTDAVVIARLTVGGTMAAGVSGTWGVLIMQDQSAATQYNAVTYGGTTGGTCDEVRQNTGMTAWTGAWSVCLQHGGVTAGGTLRYRWSVYKCNGQ